MKITASSWIKFFLAGFYFAFSLRIFGFTLRGYPFSLPLLFLLLALAVILLFGKFRGLPLFFGALFILWAVSINIFHRAPLDSYLFSLTALFLLWIPLMMRIPVPQINTFLQKWFLYGGILSFVFLYYDLLIIVFNAPALSEFPFIMNQSTGGALDRAAASMPEPAHYAAYLVFLLAGLDHFKKKRDIPAKYVILYKFHIFLGLILTVSLSGFILAGIYFLSKMMIWVVKDSAGKFPVKIPKKTTVVMIIAAVILVLLLPYTRRVLSQTASRLRKIPEVIMKENGAEQGVPGSTHKRLNAIHAAFLYIEKGRLAEILSGEGYAQYKDWLVCEYGDIYRSRDIAGTLQNIFSIVVLSTGLMGLLLYLGFISSVFYSSRHRIPVSVLVLWIAYHFATGHMIIYPLFGYLYLFGSKETDNA